MNFDAIFFIGPQGSGKGTQAKQLAARLNFFHWEMGAILRAEAGLGTELGKNIAETINQGHLVPDQPLFKVVDDYWPKVTQGQGIIFDGVPRNLPQAEQFLPWLNQRGYKKFATVSIDVPRAESVKRLMERAHHEFRQDDTAKGINERLEIYDKTTRPVIEYLAQQTALYNIDGVGSIEQIAERINSALHV